MSREILLLVDALSREKNVDKETVFGALELALASATKKRFKEDVDVRASVDRTTGAFSFFRRWQVMNDGDPIEEAARQVPLSEARKEHPEIQTGEFIEKPLGGLEVGRIGAQTAKQVILQ
ncbi:MAG: NusA N-terminal domain-containing protein, partial [Gammaproteobacteria bacterium]